MSNNALLVAGLAVVLFIVGAIAVGFGVTTSAVVAPSVVEPPANVGFFDSIFAPFRYVFSALGSVIQLGTFQANIPTLFGFIFIGISAFIALVVIGMIRGSRA